MRRSVLLMALMGSSLLLVGTLVAIVAIPRSSVAVPAGTQSPQREPLPPGARDLLKPWMQHHREDINSLLGAVLVLKYDDIDTIAMRLATDPHLSRPTSGDWESINSAMPKKFYDIQDQFQAAARKVAADARNRDNNALGTDFGGLMQTCVACHSRYMEPRTP